MLIIAGKVRRLLFGFRPFVLGAAQRRRTLRAQEGAEREGMGLIVGVGFEEGQWTDPWRRVGMVLLLVLYFSVLSGSS